MGVELGVWEGNYDNQKLRWLRWWDNEGNVLLIGNERAVIAEREIQIERDRAEQRQKQAISRLFGMGLTVEQIADALALDIEAVREHRLR